MKIATEYSLQIGERTTHVITTDWFLKNAMRVRFWLYRNEDIVLTNRGAPYAYIRPISDDEEELLTGGGLPDEVLVTAATIGAERRKFQKRLLGGKDYYLSYYKGIVGSITANIPEDIIEGMAMSMAQE